MGPIVKNAIEYVEKLFQNNADGHDAAHSLRVHKTALMLAWHYEGCDGEVIELAALLHDVDDHKLFSTENNANARRFLEGQGIEGGRIERILRIINEVSFSRNRGKRPSSIEGMIVQDADRLDALGAVGIARTFAYGGKNGRTLEESLQHFYDKLLLLKDEMNTDEARRIAQERHEYLIGFLEELQKETMDDGCRSVTRVYFVRHAESNCGNHDDALRELTEKGMEDRKKVTDFLADKSVAAVLSSPYRRAVDTVADFAKAHGLKVELIDDFRERAVQDKDNWIDDFSGFSKKQWSDFLYKLPGGESLFEVQKRNVAALNAVLKKYAGKTVVIGSHGTALSTVVNYFDSSFSYEGFERIKGIMPWIVEFVFDENGQCKRITECELS